MSSSPTHVPAASLSTKWCKFVASAQSQVQPGPETGYVAFHGPYAAANLHWPSLCHVPDTEWDDIDTTLPPTKKAKLTKCSKKILDKIVEDDDGQGPLHPSDCA
jgi:hypothetical protein